MGNKNIKQSIDIKNENKNSNLTINNENILNQKIHFLTNLVNDSYSDDWLIDKFIAFKSINDIFYLIYSNYNKSIISYNIIFNKKINETKKAHKTFITNFRYYLDNINKRDLIISISSDDNNIKLWNINNFELLLNITKIYKAGYLESACFLNNENKYYIVTSNKSNSFAESIKVYDFKGNKIKEINNSNETTYYIDIYYDSESLNNYIITGNIGYIKTYDYNENKIYHKYSDSNIGGRFSIIINKKKDVIELIESSGDGNIRIWDFHLGILLKKIKVSDESLREICLWNEKYVFVGCDDKTIKIIELNNGKIIKELKGHNDKVLSIKVIIHPKYGEYLISKGAYNDQIIIWTLKFSIFK